LEHDLFQGREPELTDWGLIRDVYMNNTIVKKGIPPSEMISEQISKYNDWRGELLAQIRNLILRADDGIVEEWKWGTPVWSKGGLICSGVAFKDHVKLNFFKGAALKDPNKLFNAGQEAKESRGIDLYKGDQINEAGLEELVHEAIDYNLSGAHN
jgi:hypothetical protein